MWRGWRNELFSTARNPTITPKPLALYCATESQEVLRRGASETAFWGSWPVRQSGAHSKEPRVVRGSGGLATRLSELEGLVLAERAGFEPAVGY